jgi:hypothetical protein
VTFAYRLRAWGITLAGSGALIGCAGGPTWLALPPFGVGVILYVAGKI